MEEEVKLFTDIFLDSNSKPKKLWWLTLKRITFDILKNILASLILMGIVAGVVIFFFGYTPTMNNIIGVSTGILTGAIGIRLGLYAWRRY